MPHKRRICFVTGTRAEFGLMQSTLAAIKAHPDLQLQIVVTGMHLSELHGKSIDSIRRDGWTIDAVAPWPSLSSQRAAHETRPAHEVCGNNRSLRARLLSPGAHDPLETAAQTGLAMSELAKIFTRLHSDILLVVGDRVEAFAAATAGQIGGLIVAHVHGGDRAMGQSDDSLRHAITKLAHIHFPATVESADRIKKLGEQRFRIFRVGSPGLDGIRNAAANRLALRGKYRHQPGKFALLVLHPADANESLEFTRAQLIYTAVRAAGIENIVIIYPNNDPGSGGIIGCWRRHQDDPGVISMKNVDRVEFLGLMRDSAMLVGNSSAGIIEAASFGTPVIDIGPRQRGRQRGENVTNVDYTEPAIFKAIKSYWNHGHPPKCRAHNIYAAPRTAEKIAHILATIHLDDKLRRKLIEY